MRVNPDEYRRLPLEAHRVLERIPLRDVSAVDLPGGGEGRTLGDVHALLGSEDLLLANAATAALVRLRFAVGGVLGWDGEHVSRTVDVVVPPELAARSRIAPGAKDGLFTVLYAVDREEVRELVNATAHVCLASALVPRGDGYRLLWAVHVRNVSRLTPVYLAAIEPFRRLVVYPSMLGRIRKAWIRRYGEAHAPGPVEDVDTTRAGAADGERARSAAADR